MVDAVLHDYLTKDLIEIPAQTAYVASLDLSVINMSFCLFQNAFKHEMSLLFKVNITW